jgi:hypothetical protein
MSRQHLSVPAAMVMSLLFLVSCTSSGSASDRDALTAAQTRAEYWQEAKTLTLAPGWKWPADSPQATGILDNDPGDGGRNVYERGFGRAWADDYWFCSWKGHLVSADLSDTERDQALTEAEKIRNTHRYRNGSEPAARAADDRILKKARLGDYSEMREDVRLNCPRVNR